ncbi:unnamed protein product [Owenia fusiformis]|uniref:pyruvate dehydrogenase (NADP(+)) n=1 Tax=Owenia fusiformis TaxID=6347 RepID=A0A8S4N482_OWEFU|nr:unnamed protein product [Owenia fusiformis]
MAQTTSSTKAQAQAKLAEKPKEHPWVLVEGNEAAATMAYAMSEISFIYPISPATSMGDYMDKWMTEGRRNLLDQPVHVNMMQSEGGAAGALHGAAAAGTLSSTFTASQGLLLMIPNMYLLAGELVPTVLHVSARTVSKHALSIFNDHSDVMACRQTGFAMLCSSSVQEIMDFGAVAHISSMKSRLPFMHFFDGYRTSAEVSKIKSIPYEELNKIFPHEMVDKHLRNFALNPNKPMVRGTGQRPDIFFQSTVAANKFYQACPNHVEETFRDIEMLTGRKYNLFDYHGSPDATRVAVLMGSGAKTMEETVDYLNSKGENVGVITPRLFRPWSAEHFLRALPKSVEHVAVLDRTREDGAIGMPLFLDISVTLSDAGLRKNVTGGQYGLASKEFTPEMCKAVFDNLSSDKPKSRYVIGIEDDVTHTSLSYGEKINTVPEGTTQCLFWGLGTDGTVGASKTAIRTIGLNTDLKGQGHFVFDSHKGDGVTVSHVRFGPSDIKSEYEISANADYISCAHASYVNKFDLISPLKEGGIFVLNTPFTTLEEMEKKLPDALKKEIAQKKAQFYNIDATTIALELGLGKRVNMVMQAAFYFLSGVLPVDQAISLLKESIIKQYGKKGPKMVDMNQRAVDATIDNLKKMEYSSSWAQIGDVVPTTHVSRDAPEFIKNIMDPVLALEGDKLPVSAFEPGGYQPTGTTLFEKRGIAPAIPVWIPDNCTQCNYCTIVCPHAVVRPFLLDKSEVKGAPKGYESRKSKGGAEVAGFNYTIQISPFDCTGCEVCVQSCPDDALYMAPFKEVSDQFKPHWDYSIGLPERSDVGDKFTVKGSQFQTPLMEFSGACAGCGETPYVKLITQLFGDRMVIANSSGCSSVWGGTSTTIPFSKNSEGKGPAWGRSLFEDTAEYGFGMVVATKQRRTKLKKEITTLTETEELPDNLKKAFGNWLKNIDNAEPCEKFSSEIEDIIGNMDLDTINPALRRIYEQRDMLRTQSHWIVGGDGWAYDIGYGGLDHVLSKAENVNILVLDTEMYSNTGGQVSKATQLSTVTKFASSGKRQSKKDLGMMAMMYENVYVASVALGANMNQCVQAMKEAESYNGTSLVICYAPCIDWGIEMKYMMDEMKDAVDSGYWSLYRFDPRRAEQGSNPFTLDSRRIKTELQAFLNTENRFQQLVRMNKNQAIDLHAELSNLAKHKHEKFKKMAMDEYEMLDYLKGTLGEEISGDKSLVLYASETGNAEALSNVFAHELKRRGIRASCMAFDDYDFDDLPNQSSVYCVVATCGQGEFPANSKTFWEQMSNKDLAPDTLANTKFAVFGLGDTGYVYYNESAKQFDKRFEELGATRILNIGLGDDKDEEKYETAWNEWCPELWSELGTPAPPQELLPASYSVYIDQAGTIPVAEGPICAPPGTKQCPMPINMLLSPPDYDRDIRHYEFDLKGLNMPYGVGECLGIYPHNDPKQVDQFLQDYGMSPNAVVQLEDTTNRKEPYPSIVSAKQLFTEIIDIFGRPSRRFYEALGILCKDESEKKRIEFLLSKEGKDDFRELVKETTTYADLLKMFPSANVPLEYIIDYIPRIKPRLYSIASSQEMHGDRLHLCIVKEDWTTPSGKYQEGACTRYLQHLSLDGKLDSVAGRINAAGITLPDTQKPPYIMVGLGTGLAPLRAMVEEREMARVRGEECGQMALFFGARYKRTDYTYGDELEEYHSNGKGVLTVLSNAFSRDQAHKIYVQDRIKEHPEVVYDYLVKQKGYFYLCGPAGNVPTAVRKGVCEAFVSQGGMTMEQADKYITDMQIEGRYNIEAW